MAHDGADNWLQTGWITGAHCGQAAAVFTEAGSAGNWQDKCWTNSFPLVEGTNYYFAVTDSGTSTWTSWLYWNQSWYQLGTADMAHPLATAAAVPTAGNCVISNCVDPIGTIVGVGGVGMLGCAALFEVCGPTAAAYGTFYTVFGLVISAVAPVDNCKGFAYVPTFSSGTVSTGGTTYCETAVYALGNTAFALKNNSAFTGSGYTCNYCSRIDITVAPQPADYYANYTSKESYWSADSSGQTVDKGDRYAGPSCECYQ